MQLIEESRRKHVVLTAHSVGQRQEVDDESGKRWRHLFCDEVVCLFYEYVLQALQI